MARPGWHDHRNQLSQLGIANNGTGYQEVPLMWYNRSTQPHVQCLCQNVYPESRHDIAIRQMQTTAQIQAAEQDDWPGTF